MTVMGSITSRYLPRTKEITEYAVGDVPDEIGYGGGLVVLQGGFLSVSYSLLNQPMIVWAAERPFSAIGPETPSATLLAIPIHFRIGVALLMSLETPSRFLLMFFTLSDVSGRLRLASARLCVVSSMLSRFRLMDGAILRTAKVSDKHRIIPVPINKIATMPVATSIIHQVLVNIVSSRSLLIYASQGENLLFTDHAIPVSVSRARDHRFGETLPSSLASLHPLLPRGLRFLARTVH